jgi:transcriptional regulator with XRE-family HTH domain
LAQPIRNRELGRRLRRAMREARVDGLTVSTALGTSVYTVSRWLTGRLTPSVMDAASILLLCQVPRSQRQEILELLRPECDPGVLRLPVEEQWDAYRAFAADAKPLVEFASFMVPWLVQTPHYTHAYLMHVPPSGGDVVAVEAKARQAPTVLDTVLRLNLLLHECALRIPVGGSEVMADQVRYLALLAFRFGVSVRIIPANNPDNLAIPAGFTLMDFADFPSVIYRDDPTGAILLDHHRDIAAYRDIADRLSDSALDEDTSLDLLTTIAAEYDQHTTDTHRARLTHRCDTAPVDVGRSPTITPPAPAEIQASQHAPDATPAS